MNDILRKYWEILTLCEDYLDDGFQKNRSTPSLSFPSKIHMNAERLTHGRRLDELNSISDRVAVCTLCKLHTGRTKAVPGEGVLDPLVMCVGEGPGMEEDRTGRPFVGKAGHYLDKWLQAVELDRRTNCYIANIVKCRPPQNRDPQPDEISACLPYLERQVALIRPRTILALGRVAAQALLGTSDGVGGLRGRSYRFHTIPLVVTYHPSGVLRNQDLRRAVWEDLKRLSSHFG